MLRNDLVLFVCLNFMPRLADVETFKGTRFLAFVY